MPEMTTAQRLSAYRDELTEAGFPLDEVRELVAQHAPMPDSAAVLQPDVDARTPKVWADGPSAEAVLSDPDDLPIVVVHNYDQDGMPVQTRYRTSVFLAEELIVQLQAAVQAAKDGTDPADVNGFAGFLDRALGTAQSAIEGTPPDLYRDRSGRPLLLGALRAIAQARVDLAEAGRRDV
ncbi:hypothetical protein [Acrocarpospora sp. B8E8]|uniref:hypothetical protein n=1 Tax=Acrocarpospora sp. B8E8 TaxID=3153572 RepID=UPI00325CCBA6